MKWTKKVRKVQSRPGCFKTKTSKLPNALSLVFTDQLSILRSIFSRKQTFPHPPQSYEGNGRCLHCGIHDKAGFSTCSEFGKGRLILNFQKSF